MKSILTLITGISLSLASYSQSLVRGSVKDEKQQPAEFATVLLLTTADSTLIKSVLTDARGSFVFNNISNGVYKMTVTMVGYQKASRNVTVNAAEIIVPEIRLSSGNAVLKEVNVTAKRPFLEQRPDKLVVNVDGSATAAGSTALEILQKVPGLIMSNDNITIVGKGTPVILIDGRTSQYTDISQVLKDMSAVNIDRIEVIGNPGAKYDAAGGSVINIILKRNASLGTNGSIGLATGMGIYDRSASKTDRNFYRVNPSISLNHRKGKHNTFGSYSYLDRNQYDFSEFSRVISGQRYFQENYSPGYASSHNFRAGADFYADNKNTFGVVLRGFIRDGDRKANNVTVQSDAATGNFLSTFQTANNTDSKRSNFSGNLNWKHSFDTTGTDLNVDFDYSDFRIRNNSEIINRLADGSQYINNQRVDNPVRFGVLKADFEHPFSKETKLAAGLKTSIASIDNYLIFMQNGMVDNERTTDFIYKENINAAYATFDHKVNKWSLQAGLRTEQTVAKGSNRSEQVLDRDYWQLFPSAFISRELNSKLSTVLQYSRRVNRPSFQQQNPFIEYIDSLTYTKGNPMLKPETADQYKLSLTYQNQPFFAISYNRTNDVIFGNAPRQDGNLTYTTAENLASYQNFTAELNFPLNFGKKISGYGGNQFIYNHYKANYLGGIYDRDKWNWLAYWQLTYKPAPVWSMEVSGYYMTNFLNEFISINELGSLNFAIQRSLWGKKGRISLNANDILFTDRTKADIIYQDINVNMRQWYESRNIRLTFSYSFGNQQLKAARSRKTASEDEANRVKTN